MRGVSRSLSPEKRTRQASFRALTPSQRMLNKSPTQSKMKFVSNKMLNSSNNSYGPRSTTVPKIRSKQKARESKDELK